MTEWIPVSVESPYAGKSEPNSMAYITEVAENVRYARMAYRDCLVHRNEAPFASHLNYTQEGVLDDTDPEERKAGMEAGKAIEKFLSLSAFYVDRGFSGGMKWGLKAALEADRPVVFRSFNRYNFTDSIDLDVQDTVERFGLQEFLHRILIVNGDPAAAALSQPCP